MRIASLLLIGSLAALAGCAGDTPPPPRSAAAATPSARAPAGAEAGLGRVMGQPAPALTVLFGAAELDLREGPARKLQFRGAACVLDAYLYPPPAGGAARVTWLDARTPAGDDIDRASCIAALSRRRAVR